MPHLFTYAVEATKRGIPMMRAMVLEFLHDPTCHYLDRQYMFGERLMVAPILNDKGTAHYYVPEGTWTNLLTGTRVNGGRWLEEQIDYMTLPLLVRPNSLIAIGCNNQRTDYDYTESVTYHLFELEDGATASTIVCALDGHTVAEIRATREENTIHMITDAEQANKPWSIILRGIHTIQSIEDASFNDNPDVLQLLPNEGVNQLHIHL